MKPNTDPFIANDFSSNGREIGARKALYQRFQSRIVENQELNRRLVSYQANKEEPGLRWLKYKEGFSAQLIEKLLGQVNAKRVLDPFAGIGTVPLVATGVNLDAMGIEIMPVGISAAKAISHTANGLIKSEFEKAGKDLLSRIRYPQTNSKYRFRHVTITEKAFPERTEDDIAKAREFLSECTSKNIGDVLNFACMSVLEDVSYTSKDGQYLRWDHRSGRNLRTKMEKKSIIPFSDALSIRLSQICNDMDQLKQRFGGRNPKFVNGSCLENLATFEDNSFDTVITSPPYANRYDYTRTYALELAYLGYDQDNFRNLRQALLSATVENHSKRSWLEDNYANSRLINLAFGVYDSQSALHEALVILRDNINKLGNPNVIRLLENYFLEMAVLIAELGRIVSPNGNVFVVNDNVQYYGEEIPVDLILSDFAEQMGFQCKKIWKLPRGKGNASQQMGLFGRP